MPHCYISNSVRMSRPLTHTQTLASTHPIWISLNTPWFGPLSECHRTFIFIPLFLLNLTEEWLLQMCSLSALIQLPPCPVHFAYTVLCCVPRSVTEPHSHLEDISLQQMYGNTESKGRFFHHLVFS